ncbi:MAG: DNA photolyase family protein [Carboxylicivirga sp.]|nr:DNA photolyase family protein [Carboxylicivirga sp.]
MTKITIHWFRRDLRLTDNRALNAALMSQSPVLPLFIFDDKILDELPKEDARVTFIHQELERINKQLKEKHGSSLLIKKGDPLSIWKDLLEQYTIESVHFNRDYEPYALDRDGDVEELLKANNINVITHQDHVIFEADKILKKDNTPYTIYTPYKKQWLNHFNRQMVETVTISSSNFTHHQFDFPNLETLGFKKSSIMVPDYKLDQLDRYAAERDFPALESTSMLGTHLRFGTVSIRQIISQLNQQHEVFLSELIWREFFMQIMVHHPRVITNNFKPAYDAIPWRNNEQEFKRWCEGTTGFPMVDAGMRELKQTGLMHNRVRMVCASFLCKHLLIDWRWGEAYFAKKLLDFELSSNNGNWQWAASTGCDAAPYFRVFNPIEQQKKFDPDLKYIRKWVTEFDSLSYPTPILDHRTARLRAIDTYKTALKS